MVKSDKPQQRYEVVNARLEVQRLRSQQPLYRDLLEMNRRKEHALRRSEDRKGRPES